jgi:hypothetical protein
VLLARVVRALLCFVRDSAKRWRRSLKLWSASR